MSSSIAASLALTTDAKTTIGTTGREGKRKRNSISPIRYNVAGQFDFNTNPEPRTFAPSKEDVLQNVQYFFCAPVSPQKLKDYSEHPVDRNHHRNVCEIMTATQIILSKNINGVWGVASSLKNHNGYPDSFDAVLKTLEQSIELYGKGYSVSYSIVKTTEQQWVRYIWLFCWLAQMDRLADHPSLVSLNQAQTNDRLMQRPSVYPVLEDIARQKGSPLMMPRAISASSMPHAFSLMVADARA